MKTDKVQEEYFRLFFYNSSDAIFFTSPEGHIYNCNPAAIELFGFTEEEFYAKGRDLVLDPTDSYIISALKAREKTGEFSGILYCTKKNAIRFPAEVTSKVFKFTDGTLRTITTVRDISNRLERDKILAYQGTIIDNVSDAIFTFDKNTTITSWNKSAEKLYGWKAEEAIGKNSAELLRTTASESTRRNLFEILNTKKEVQTEVIHFRKDNVQIYVEARSMAILDQNENILGYVTVNRDVTKRKMEEAKHFHEKERLEILADLAGVFAKVTSDYTEVLHYTSKKLAEGIGDLCVIKLLNVTEKRFQYSSFSHKNEDILKFLNKIFSEHIPWKYDCYSGEVLNNSKPLLIPVMSDLSLLKDDFKSYAEQYGLSSLVIVPIAVEGKILGTISLSRNKPGNPYTSDDQMFLENVAGKIGFAISKAKLFNEKVHEIEDRKAFEKALTEQKNLLQDILEIIPVGVFILDAEGNRIIGNKMANDIWKGIKYNSPEDSKMYEVWWPDTGEILKTEEKPSIRALKGETVLNEEILIKCFDGSYKTILGSAVPIIRSDKISGAIVVNVDITELKKINEEKIETEKRYQNILDNMVEGCAILDYNWNYIYVNEANAKHAHLKQHDMIGRNMLKLIPGVEKSIFFETYTRCMKERESLSVESEFVFDNGLSNWYEVRVMPVPEGIFILSIDITERKQIEQKIKSSEETLRFALDVIHVGLWELDVDNMKSKRTRQHAKIFGYENTDLDWSFEKFISHVTPEDREEVTKRTRESINARSNIDYECRIIRLDGQVRWIRIAAQHFLGKRGTYEKFIGIVEDVTDRKNAIETITAALKEKEVLIRELYHRTKNNMQVIYSLLGLKGESVQDENVKSILDDMKNRIHTIALVHQKLYQSNNLSRIDLKDYITELTTLLINGYSASDKRIDLKLNLESIFVLIDIAVPCGLVINELISNSLKHAFQGRSEGEICVSLRRPEKESIELIISDNGIGIPEGMDMLSNDTIGAQLFYNIVEAQLGGEISIETKNGVTCTILFKDVFYEERV